MSESESAGHAVALAQAALAGKADDLVLIDVSELTLLADYFLILTGMSDRHVRALAERLADDGRERGRKPLSREGERLGRWILLDYGDVVVHIFDPQTREFYNIAQLWADAPRVEVPLPPMPSDASIVE